MNSTLNIFSADLCNLPASSVDVLCRQMRLARQKQHGTVRHALSDVNSNEAKLCERVLNREQRECFSAIMKQPLSPQPQGLTEEG